MKKSMHEKKLRTLVNMMWKTTFVLDNGTRLKTIPIEWNELSPAQQSTVISELRRVCITELKNLAYGSRLHLEFNDIPQKLRAMLVDIGGEDNPDFTWGIIGKDTP